MADKIQSVKQTASHDMCDAALCVVFVSTNKRDLLTKWQHVSNVWEALT